MHESLELCGAAALTFSVVIPLYQKRARIETCLRSALAQTHPAEEIVVIDDGSTDDGAGVVRELGSDRIRLVHQPNQGAAAARNHGLRLARGAYVAFLDADDTWDEGHLAALAELAHRHPDATLLGTSWTRSGQREPEPGQVGNDHVVDLRTFLRRGAAGLPTFWTSAVAVRRSALPATDLFPVGSRVSEDTHAWLTMMEIGPGARTDEVTADYYRSGSNSTIATPHPDDFQSAAFTKDPRRTGPEYRRFANSHRLYTINRHIGHTPSSVLLGHLARMGRPIQPVTRMRMVARIMRHELRRRAQ